MLGNVILDAFLFFRLIGDRHLLLDGRFFGGRAVGHHQCFLIPIGLVTLVTTPGEVATGDDTEGEDDVNQHGSREVAVVEEDEATDDERRDMEQIQRQIARFLAFRDTIEMHGPADHQIQTDENAEERAVVEVDLGQQRQQNERQTERHVNGDFNDVDGLDQIAFLGFDVRHQTEHRTDHDQRTDERYDDADAVADLQKQGEPHEQCGADPLDDPAVLFECFHILTPPMRFCIASPPPRLGRAGESW